MSDERSIVVPLDGSAVAERAVPLAADLARKRGAVLRLVHVHLPIVAEPIYVESLPVIDEQLHSLRREHERAYLEQARQRLTGGASCTVAVLDGSVAAALEHEAQRTRAEMLVLATHGRGGVERFWLGSVADALARTSPVPLLLVRPDTAPPSASFRRILVPLDGSEGAETILKPVLRVARLQAGSQLTLVQVVEPMPIVAWPPEVPMPPSTRIEELARHEADAARAYLCGIAARLEGDGVPIVTRVVFRTPVARAILEVAEEGESDLIALASHGRSGLSRLALGSVADKLVRGSRVPILLGRVGVVGD